MIWQDANNLAATSFVELTYLRIAMKQGCFIAIFFALTPAPEGSGLGGSTR